MSLINKFTITFNDRKYSESIITNPIEWWSWSFGKNCRYYLVFRPLHFVCYNLQFGINKVEQNEFYDRYHYYNTTY